MSTKKLRLSYNPYCKKLAFRYSADGEKYGTLAPESPLSKYEHGEYSLSTCAPKLLSIIEESYAVDSSGIEICFEGTQADYEQIQATLNSYSNKPEARGKLRLSQSEEPLIGAVDANERIDRAYAKISTEFPKDGTGLTVDEKEVAEIVSKYHNAARAELNLIIVGTYSAGKSTFINALLGEELLPQGQDPVTGQITKITSGNDCSIRFEVFGKDDKKESVLIRFADDKYEFVFEKSEKVADYSSLCGEIRRAIENSGASSVPGKMQSVIRFFDDAFLKNGGYKFEPLIEVTYPFDLLKRNSKELTVNLYDTPGSENANTSLHLKALEAALEKQTNALPIIVMGRDCLATRGNEDMNKLVEKYSGTIDVANALVVITKADEISVDELNRGISGDTLKRWEQKCILFISSVVALYANKGELASADYAEKAETAKAKFDPKSKFYRQLYRYALLPDSKKERLNEAAEKSAVEDRLRFDCGLRAIEYLISAYADEMLQYLKAQQRHTYLSEALQKAENLLAEKKDKEEKAKKAHSAARDEKRKELVERINNYEIDDVKYTEISEKLRAFCKADNVPYIKSLLSKAESTLKKIKNKKPKGKSLQYEFNEEMMKDCNRFVQDKFPGMQDYSKNLYLDLSNAAVTAIKELVKTDQDLSDAAKQELCERLRCDTLEFNTTTAPDFNFHKAKSDFLLWHWINPTKYCEELTVSFSSFFLDTCIHTVHKSHKKEFDEWLSEAKKAFNTTLDTGNLELREYAEKILTLENEINSMRERLGNLADTKQQLNGLLEFKRERELKK